MKNGKCHGVDVLIEEAGQRVGRESDGESFRSELERKNLSGVCDEKGHVGKVVRCAKKKKHWNYRDSSFNYVELREKTSHEGYCGQENHH